MKRMDTLALAGLLAGAVFTTSAGTFSYDSTDVPKALLDTSGPGLAGVPGTTLSTLTLSSSATISDLNVFVDLTHTYMGDLEIFLTHLETAKSVQLINGIGGAGDNLSQVTFDDEAATSITQGNPPYGPGTFRSQPLSAFDGESLAGTWQLKIIDSSWPDTGTLLNWGLRGEAADPISGVPDAASTGSLLGLSLVGIAAACRKLKS